MSIDFDKARDEAFRRLKKDRKKAEIDVQWSVAEQIKNTACMVQAIRDLGIYPLWDAVAMWLDDKAGLAYYCPEDMERVARLLGLTGLSEHIT